MTSQTHVGKVAKKVLLSSVCGQKVASALQKQDYSTC